jgi:hypothetical protein
MGDVKHETGVPSLETAKRCFSIGDWKLGFGIGRLGRIVDGEDVNGVVFEEQLVMWAGEKLRQ